MVVWLVVWLVLEVWRLKINETLLRWLVGCCKRQIVSGEWKWCVGRVSVCFLRLLKFGGVWKGLVWCVLLGCCHKCEQVDLRNLALWPALLW